MIIISGGFCLKIPLHFTFTFTCTHHERTLSWPGQETHAHLNYCYSVCSVESSGAGDNTTQETKDDYRIIMERKDQNGGKARACFALF